MSHGHIYGLFGRLYRQFDCHSYFKTDQYHILTQICCITFIYKCFNCCKTLLNDLYVPDQDASDGIQTEETDDKETVM